MNTKSRVAIAIIIDNKIFLIHRIKDGHSYYILPGGGVEHGESPLNAVIREIKEELNIDVKILKKLIEFKNRGQMEFYYLADNFSGNLKVIGDSLLSNNIKDEGLWLGIDLLDSINLLPEKIKIFLIDYFRKKQL
jgi:8-oxo-dGTP pyrophosphatase MutT (NUDIX family)